MITLISTPRRAMRPLLIAVAVMTLASSGVVGELPDDNRKFKTIFNNDTNNILYAMDSDKSPEDIVADYRRALTSLLDGAPGILAQNVGNPDPVIYRSEEATLWNKYIEGHQSQAMDKMLQLGTDPFQVTIDVCRERGVPVLASYRMNAEDFYEKGLEIQDFGRAHKHLAIPGANCLDPAHPVVYEHRMRIFREVAEKYDIDGIEFDFRRWNHMISDPLKNHPILTRMVRETRQMLDEVARKKGKKRMILGVRVGPSLQTPQDVAQYQGVTGTRKMDDSCQELGLDVKTWIQEELVHYVCPTLFWPDWPGLPFTAEFTALAKGHNVGIYPTIFPRPPWLNDSGEVINRGPIEPNDIDTLTEYKHGFCELALRCYADGADGISMFNWYFHLHLSRMPRQWQAYYGYDTGGSLVQKHVLSIMSDPQAIRDYQKQPWFWPPEDEPYVAGYRSPEPWITVKNPRKLPDTVPAQRTSVGIAGDYKPCLAQLPNGEILLAMFHTYPEPAAGAGKTREDALSFRSHDGGRKWSNREKWPILGREPYMTVMSDGTLVVTTHLLPEDVRNTGGYSCAFVHQSQDGGQTWSTMRIDDKDVPGAPPRAISEQLWTATTRNVLELPDGTWVMGVSAGSSRDFLWRSSDKGATWDRSLSCKVEGFDVATQGFPWFIETILARTATGDLLGIARCNPTSLSALGEQPIPKGNDQLERMVIFRSRDLGKTWSVDPELGSTYGEHYPSILRLRDGRLLLTFTVRSLNPLLGVQAVLGTESPSGPSFDFQTDRLIIDQRSSPGQISGGGFGNTVQLADGQLLTAYSYRDSTSTTHIEVVSWRLPEP